MSALGKKQTLGHVRAMSALPPRADIADQRARPPASERIVPILRLEMLRNRLQRETRNPQRQIDADVPFDRERLQRD
jgi:hypothetical protein